MNTKVTPKLTQEKALRWAAQGLTVLLVLVAAVAVMLYFKIDELEATLSQARAESDKAAQAAAAARKKLQDELNAAKTKSAALEQRQREADNMKTLLAKMEPQLATALEAVVNAKTSKPDARAAALTGLGVIGQIARGANNEAALAALERALGIDKANCVAGLAVNLGGAKKVEVAPDCQALLPGAPAASEAKPAAEAKPDAAPAGGAGKTAAPAAKG
ncbi:MAG: hypothetical protein EPO19_14025 [Betaproteobacteria bacterium]|nr:MAG: hypothetical protein EPO19_14025 [Betaproteobacteria bacterium]